MRVFLIGNRSEKFVEDNGRRRNICIVKYGFWRTECGGKEDIRESKKKVTPQTAKCANSKVEKADRPDRRWAYYRWMDEQAEREKGMNMAWPNIIGDHEMCVCWMQRCHQLTSYEQLILSWCFSIMQLECCLVHTVQKSWWSAYINWNFEYSVIGYVLVRSWLEKESVTILGSHILWHKKARSS